MATFILAVAPAVLAIWLVPGFVTQDGPAHLYNAHILARSLGADSPFREYYEVHWAPLPNWAGHLGLLALVSVLPARDADRVMMTLTLVGFSGSILWLRWRVAGWRGAPTAALLAVLLGLNVAWLFGFTSFLLGACLFPITLGVWRSNKERLGVDRAAVLAGLIVIGYFGHLVSLGLTTLGLVVLSAATPGPNLRKRACWTALSLTPLVPLGLAYRGLTRRVGGVFRPTWGHLQDVFSAASWKSQLGWVDPISLGRKVIVPFVEVQSAWLGLFAPVLWFVSGLTLLVVATLLTGRRGNGERRGWGWLAVVLLAGGLLGPDSLGPDHGDYLPQRIALMGLTAMVPWLDLGGERGGRLGRLGFALLLAAVALQSAGVWDYARKTDRLTTMFEAARPHLGKNQRVGTLLIDIRGVYRPNPLLHLDNLLGIGTGDVVWNNYETRFYYFPVQFRPEVRRPPAAEFEEIAKLDRNPIARADRWRSLLEDHRDEIDVLIVWGADDRLDAINELWFKTIYQNEDIRVMRRR